MVYVIIGLIEVMGLAFKTYFHKNVAVTPTSISHEDLES
jgi:hypothetical protein